MEQFIGNYQVIKKVGAGGMAEVFLASHKLVPNLKVILKILKDRTLEERFKQEADKLALLDGHKHICSIKDFFVFEDKFVIAMEYIEGVTLLDYIYALDRIPIDNCIKIIQNILETLKFAHDNDIYHRDIKPNNIMIDNNSIVKVIDFGIAKGKGDPNLTVIGGMCGTLAYMAPEQFTKNQPTNFALIDIYACGVTLYFMTTGELLFQDDNELTIRDSKLNTVPAKPQKLNPDIPDSLNEIIMKSIEKDPVKRYQTIDEMLEAFDKNEITKGKTIPEDKPTVISKKKDFEKDKKKSRIPVLYLGIIGVLLLFYIVYDYSQNQNNVNDNIDSSKTNPTIIVDNITDTQKTNIKEKDNILSQPELPAISSKNKNQDNPVKEEITKQDRPIITKKETVEESIYSPAGINQNDSASIKAVNTNTLCNFIIGSKPPGADIYINSELQSEQTNHTFQLEPGNYIISVKLAGYPSKVDTIQIVTGDKKRKKMFEFSK
ncbi:MAG: serine/threonine-protein kinase [Candidatus Zixiibacteriota bacterium]